MNPSVVTRVNNEGVVPDVGFVEMVDELPASFIEPVAHGIIFGNRDWPAVDCIFVE